MDKQQMVRDFHAHVGAPEPRLLCTEKTADVQTVLILAYTAQQLRMLATALYNAATNETTGEKTICDLKLFRMALIIEEAAEIAMALAGTNDADLAQELADLEYVTIGTAETFAIPLDPVFEAVHAANMTKASSASTKSGKGDNYVKPDIAAILNRRPQ